MSATTASPAAVTTWNIDPAHSAAEFKVKHMMISNVKGRFSGLSGTLTLHEPEHTLTRVEASIDVATVNTGDVQRDGHLKSGDFFDVEKFPTMTFASTRVQPKGDGEFDVTGDLTLHGLSRTVTFAVSDLSAPGKDPWGNTRIGLTATTKINRKDFGLSWNAALEAGGFLVGDEITISLDVQFLKA
ncbi:MAG TPA: YceI family protein [Terracidiphilus sp.]|nr:YceI family protein [Terracidiphilus sp.]